MSYNKGNQNIARLIRIQLKNGYLKEAPMEYKYMQRNPPIAHAGPAFQTFSPQKEIPYYSLYDKVLQSNPLYRNESVYPAYWTQETQALQVAKKQYNYMNEKNMSEEDALKMAKKDVDAIEYEQYDLLNNMMKTFKKEGVQASFLADPEVSKELYFLRELMENKTYDELELADQSEIDYFIQTKILKWVDVERDRRMKDPIFAMAFDKFRDYLFPNQGIDHI